MPAADIWRASIMELIGCFALTFSAVKYINPVQFAPKPSDVTDAVWLATAGIPIVEIEAAKMVFVLAFFTWAGVAVSGAHYNPIVTISMFMAKKTDPVSAVFYLIAQAIGAVSAGLLQLFLTAGIRKDWMPGVTLPRTSWNYFLPFTNPDVGFIRASLCQFISAFVFIIVYQSMLVEKRAPKGVNCFAVGLAYGLAYLTVGYATGGTINPYIYLLPRVFTLEIADVISFTVGPLFGAIAGAVYFRFLLQTDPNAAIRESAPIRRIVV